MFENRIEDGDEFAHAGDERNFLGFAALQQTAVEGTQDRVMANAYQSSHVERGAQMRAAAPRCAPSAHRAAVMVERSYADQGGDLAPVKPTQLRQPREQGYAQYRTDAGHTSEQVFPFAPQRRVAQRAVEVTITLLKSCFEPADMGADLPVKLSRHGAKPVALGGQHL